MKKHCSVRNCKNYARPGSRTCGCHGKRKAPHSRSTRTRFVHLDSRVPELVSELETIMPVEDVLVEVRDGGIIIGLPTNRQQMVSFLGNWLQRHTLDEIERLTPPVITPAPLLANSFCAIAAALVRYDLQAVQA